MRYGLVALVGPAMLWTPMAAAQELSGSSVSQVQVHGDNENGQEDDDDFMILAERVELAASAGELVLGARLDGNLFVTPPHPAYSSDYTLERISVQWSRDAVGVLVGDFPVQLGRGLALSLRRAPEVGADLALRGARVSLDGEVGSASAMAGVVNAASMDALSLRAVEEPGDVAAGAQVQLLPGRGLEIGALSSLVVPRERLLEAHTDWTATAGAWLRAQDLPGSGSATLEVDVQQRSLAGVQRPGAAALADLGVELGAAHLLLEALWLADFEIKGSRNTATGARFDYNQPPTLERVDQEVQNHRDVLGGRARIDVPWSSVATLWASQMVRLGELRSPIAVVQTHGMVGMELDANGSRWALAGGLRLERLGLDKLAMLRDMVHLDSDALVPLGHGFSVHSATSMQLWRSVDRPFARGSSLLTLDRVDRGAVGAELGLDTQDPSPERRHLYLAAVVSVALLPELTLRATAGSQRGGIRCVGGVCREVPSFAGTRGELELRF
ncbi:MAG: hypothetical protein IT382_17340 [Deltaproteobacteria bacterium]|nr:hypothetical protein [Deltaproteobacteria bacterium]